MKMMYNGVPIKSLNIKHYEMDSNFATVEPSDMQAGKTAVARGKKITGTGKSFEFAWYGRMTSNDSFIIPTGTVNIVHVSSLGYPIHSVVQLSNMKTLDFNEPQIIGNLIADNLQYPISVYIQNNEIFITCDINTNFEVFFGKDNYV